jgi:hypothetical protein
MTLPVDKVRFGARKGARQEHHVHVDVAALAKDLCMASYEAAMGNNTVRAAWKNCYPGRSERELQVVWLTRHMAAHVAPARAILAGMLASPIDDGLKSKIKDALILDNFLVRGRNPSGWSK